jgi:acetyltransferase-like isoleucine patch superfamily enzyme
MRRLRLAVQSARCVARLRRHGIAALLVTCEGRLPVVHGGGRCTLGRVALRAVAAPVEIGAERGGRLVVGDRTFINQGATIVASHSIEIGRDVRIGDHVAVYDSDHHPVEEGAEVRRAPVVIGDNVWLARGVVVLPGVTIGEHAVVAAGSVVTADVPGRTLVAGNPARHVRELRAQDAWRRP